MITQPIAAIVSRGQPGPLQHRAPGSVEYHDALAQKLAEGPFARSLLGLGLGLLVERLRSSCRR
jgi:hypothetical protein